MSIYIVMGLLPVILASTLDNRYRIYKKHCADGRAVYIFMMGLAFTIVMGLRSYSVGVDTSPYTRIYKIIGTSSSLISAVKKAPLSAHAYIVLDYFLYKISPDPRLMIVVTSAIVNIFLFKFIYKASSDMCVSTCCYIGLTLFFCSMNGNRQCMAMAVLLNAMLYLNEKITDIRGWLLFILAVELHETALFGILIIIGMQVASKTRDVNRLFVRTAVFSTLFNVIFTRLIPVYTNLFPRYEMYTNGSNRYSITESTGGGRIALLYLFLLAIVVVWVITYNKTNAENDDFNYNLMPGIVFGIIFGLFNAKNELANRMLWYFLALFITFIPSFIRHFKGFSRYIAGFGAVGGLYTYSLLSLIENQNGVVPYTILK